MAITSGFFDSVNGDRTYDADQMSNYFDGLVSDGVYETIGDRFAVTSANNGMNINVGSGRAIIQSRWVKNDAIATLTLDPSDVQLNRIDAVVLRLDTTARSIELAIKKGTAVSGTPAMPAITRTETVYELYLASVTVPKGAVQPSAITDLRPSSYCGWVTGVVQQVDTSDLFVQWQTAYEQQYAAFNSFMQQKEAAFNAWFSSLTQTLTVDTTITKYQRVDVLRSGSIAGTLYDVDIPEYDQATDVLLMYVNGVFYPEIGQDEDDPTSLPYGGFIFDSQPSEPNAVIYFNRSLRANDQLMYIVLKNVIGKSVINSGNSIMIANGMISRNIGIAEQEG